MPTVTTTIGEIEVTLPYAQGHVCSQAEADTLNQLFLRSATKGVQRIVHEGIVGPWKHSEVQFAVSKFLQRHALGFREGHERLRAIEGEAKRLATLAYETELYKQGRRLRDVAKGEVDIAVAEIAAREDIITQARARIDAVQAVAREAHGALFGENEG